MVSSNSYELIICIHKFIDGKYFNIIQMIWFQVYLSHSNKMHSFIGFQLFKTIKVILKLVSLVP